MIENTSTLTREDLEFMFRKSRFSKKNRPRFIARCLGCLLGYGYAAAMIVLQTMLHDWDTWGVVCVALGLVLGSISLIELLFMEKILAGKAMKQAHYQTPRHFLLTDGYAEITTNAPGAVTKLKFGYDRADGYFPQDGVVYLRLLPGSGDHYYLCIHDDGYTQGDRKALEAFFAQHNIKALS